MLLTFTRLVLWHLRRGLTLRNAVARAWKGCAV